jgi:hypothetical protein
VSIGVADKLIVRRLSRVYESSPLLAGLEVDPPPERCSERRIGVQLTSSSGSTSLPKWASTMQLKFLSWHDGKQRWRQSTRCLHLVLLVTFSSDRLCAEKGQATRQAEARRQEPSKTLAKSKGSASLVLSLCDG